MEIENKTDEDEELVSIIQNSSNGLKEGAITRLYTKYKPKLYNFIYYNYLRNKEDAEDVVQEAFLRVFKNINKYKNIKENNNGSSLNTWIHTIAINLSLTCLRQKKRKNEVTVSQYDYNESLKYNEEKIFFYDQTPQTLFPQIDKLTERNDISNIVNKEIDNLPDIHKEALNLHEHGFSYEEISEILDIPKGTVKSRIFRGKEKLGKTLKKKNSEVVDSYLQ